MQKLATSLLPVLQIRKRKLQEKMPPLLISGILNQQLNSCITSLLKVIFRIKQLLLPCLFYFLLFLSLFLFLLVFGLFCLSVILF